jgi:nicotinamide riboside transporter PnuC
MSTAISHFLPQLPAWNWALQGIGFVSSYVGAELNARMRISGFCVWLVSNVALALLNALTGQWLLVLLYVLFSRVAISGICRWARDRPETAPRLARWLARRDAWRAARAKSGGAEEEADVGRRKGSLGGAA